MQYVLTVGWTLAAILPIASGIRNDAKADDQSAIPAKQSSAAATSKPPPLAKISVEITASWPGASPEEIEARLAIPIEQAIRSLPKLHTVRTRILNSTCRLTLTFINRADAKDRLAKIDSALQKLRELPEDVEVIQLRMQSPLQTSPLWVVWEPTSENRALTSSQMRGLRDRIAQLRNVSEVRAYGMEQSYLEVIVDEAALRRYGISFRETEGLVDRWNLRFGGKRNPGASELEKLPLKVPGSGRGVLLRDVAQIRSAAHYASRVHWNGDTTSALAITLTAKAARTEREELEKDLRGVFPQWQRDLRLEGTLSVAFPTSGVDVRAQIEFPASTSETVQSRIVKQASKELAGLLDECSWMLIESQGAARLHVGRVSEPDLLTQRMYATLSSLPGVYVSVANLREASRPIVVRITGPKLEPLRMWSETVAKRVSSLRGVSGVTILGTETAPELQVVVKAEQAKKLGVNAATLAARIGPILAKAVKPSPVDAQLPVLVRRATASGKPSDLSQLKIALPSGEQVSVSEVADVHVRAALQNIIRVDFERAVEVRIQADSQTSRHSIRQALKSIVTSTRPPDLGSEFRCRLEGAEKE